MTNMPTLILAPFVLAAATASADQYRFAYTTADFADVVSVQRLHERVIETARDFCPGYLPARHLAETRRCIAEVTRGIVESIDHPALTAISEGAVDRARLALERAHQGATSS